MGDGPGLFFGVEEFWGSFPADGFDHDEVAIGEGEGEFVDLLVVWGLEVCTDDVGFRVFCERELWGFWGDEFQAFAMVCDEALDLLEGVVEGDPLEGEFVVFCCGG